jgi:hypothetical protein
LLTIYVSYTVYNICGICKEKSFVNGLRGYDIVKLYYRPSDTQGPDSYWPSGNLLFGEDPLGPGDEYRVEIEPDIYDLRAEGELGAIYTRYDVEIAEEGYTWKVTPEDRDG